MIGGALQFDGVDDYISTLFILDPKDNSFSVLAWIKGSSPGQVIISQTDGTGWGSTRLGTNASNGGLATGLMVFFALLESESVITDGQWQQRGRRAGGKQHLEGQGIQLLQHRSGQWRWNCRRPGGN